MENCASSATPVHSAARKSHPRCIALWSASVYFHKLFLTVHFTRAGALGVMSDRSRDRRCYIAANECKKTDTEALGLLPSTPLAMSLGALSFTLPSSPKWSHGALGSCKNMSFLEKAETSHAGMFKCSGLSSDISWRPFLTTLFK